MLPARHQGLVLADTPVDSVVLKSFRQRLQRLSAPICFDSGSRRPVVTHGRHPRLRHSAQAQCLVLTVLNRFSCGSSRQDRARDPWVAQDVSTPSAAAGAAPAALNSAPYSSQFIVAARRRTNIANASGGSGNSDSRGADGPAAGGGGGGSDDSAAIASAAVAASVAAAAVAGAVASATPPPPPRATALGLLRRVVSLLRSNFLVVLLLYAVKDGAAFLLHRVTQRLTNHAAEVLLGTPISTSPGNPWWLYLDPTFIRAHPGYELLIGFFFLLSLPLIIALNSVAFTLAALVCAPPGQHPRAAATGPDAAAAAAAAAGSGSAAAAGGLAVTAGGGSSGGRGVGASLYLPPDDPAAAALADLGIHALPTAPPPPLVKAAPSAPSGQQAAAATGGAVTSAAAASPLPDEPPPTASTISAASSLSASPLAIGPPSEAATTATMDEPTSGGGPWAALKAAGASVAAVLPEAGRVVRRVWWVDLQFNLRALPLQGLCLLVLPALWAVPRLMRIQLALPAAVLEGRAGREALSRSSNLMTSSMTAYGMPFAALLATSRLLEYVQGILLVLIPPRWWREVVEVPLLIAGAFLLLKAAVRRLQDLLPLAAFLELSEQEAAAARRVQQEVVMLSTPDHPHDNGATAAATATAAETHHAPEHKANGRRPPAGRTVAAEEVPRQAEAVVALPPSPPPPPVTGGAAVLPGAAEAAGAAA